MRYLRFIPLTVLVCCMVMQAAVAQNKKLDKTLKKVDNSYNLGDFPKAQKSLKKFKAGAFKLGETNYVVEFYIREARLNLATGLLGPFEESVANCLKASAKIFGETSKNYANTLTDVAEMYNEYGNYRIAREYAGKAEVLLEKSGQMDDQSRARVYMVKAEALIGQGFAIEARQLLRGIEASLLAKAVEKETTVEGGAIKTNRVPVEELPKRFGAYAQWQTLLARSYSKEGSLDSADFAFIANRTWIRNNRKFLGETSLANVVNNFHHKVMFVENLNESLNDRELQLDNILNELKKRTSGTHAIAHDVYLEYIKELLENDNTAKYNNVKLEYQKLLNKFFPKTSVTHAKLSAIQFTAKLHADRTRNLEAQALAMLNSKAVPRNYITSERILKFLTEVAITNRNYSNAESYYKQVIDITKEIYGENTPENHLAKVELANFLLDYTNNIEQAGKIYTDSYLNYLEKIIHLKHKDRIDILLHLAKYYELTDQYKLAAQALKDNKEAAQLKYDYTDPLYAVIHDYIAELSLKIGEYEEAEKSITIALRLLDTKENREKYPAAAIHAIETQAKLYGLKGLFDEAEANLDRTQDMIKDADVVLGTDLSSAEELSALLIQLGRYSGATQILDDQIPQSEKLFGSNSLRLIGPLVNKGRVMLAKGDYTEAEKIATRANGIAVKIYGEISTKNCSNTKTPR